MGAVVPATALTVNDVAVVVTGRTPKNPACNLLRSFLSLR